MTKRSETYLPKHIHVARNATTETLLDLERARDKIMYKIFQERAKLLRVELANPDYVASWQNSEYWHIALPQALFDLLGRYDKSDVRRVCLAWLMFDANNTDDFSISTATELHDLLAQQEQLVYTDDTLTFPSPPEQLCQPGQ